MQLRNGGTSRLDAAITTAVASPMPRPLVALVVIAMVGHMPSSMAEHAVVVPQAVLDDGSVVVSPFSSPPVSLRLVGGEEFQPVADRA